MSTKNLLFIQTVVKCYRNNVFFKTLKQNLHFSNIIVIFKIPRKKYSLIASFLISFSEQFFFSINCHNLTLALEGWQ